MPARTFPHLALWLLPAALCLLLAGGAAAQPPDKKLDEKVKEIAGTAEFLRSVPKHFATLKAVDPTRRQVTLLIEGEVLPKVWQLVPDGEVKIMGWWGRLDQFRIGDRVWAWFKTDRQKQAVAISMLADEVSEQDIHGPGVACESRQGDLLTLKPVKGPTRRLKMTAKDTFYRGADGSLGQEKGQQLYVQSAGDVVRLAFDSGAFEKAREQQKAALRERWIKVGLPGTVGFAHVFSGEMDLILDHEAMRWARALTPGDKVTLRAEPPIKAVVKSVQPWRERTQVRLVVHSFDLADLSTGQRLHLLRAPPPEKLEAAQLPPDLDRKRTKEERVEWFLGSIYCTCQVKGDRCTGHFYSLASCNPNGCGMPNHMRRVLRQKIDEGLTDRQIFEELLREHGPLLLRPHLLP